MAVFTKVRDPLLWGEEPVEGFGSGARHIMQLCLSFRGVLFYSVLVLVLRGIFCKNSVVMMDVSTWAQRFAWSWHQTYFANSALQTIRHANYSQSVPLIAVTSLTPTHRLQPGINKTKFVEPLWGPDRRVGGRILLISWIYQEGRDTGLRNVRTSLRFFFMCIIMYCFV